MSLDKKPNDDSVSKVIQMYKYQLKFHEEALNVDESKRFYSIEVAILFALRNYPSKNFLVVDNTGKTRFTGFFSESLH